jgi:subtilisin family serine protease
MSAPAPNIKAGYQAGSVTPLELIGLPLLMKRTAGRPEIIVGMIDGPVALDHPDLARDSIREIPGRRGGCAQAGSAACVHGTFVAGILSARRGTAAPGICPGCTLLLRPIFSEGRGAIDGMPIARPKELAAAILECIDAGARVLNLSAALAHPTPRDQQELEAVLDHARRRGVLLVIAAGNQAMMGGSVLTRHPWVVAVVGYSLGGLPLSHSNLGAAIGREGLGAPGEAVTSLTPRGSRATWSGTSAAAPFVTGTLSLLLSEFPEAGAGEVRFAAVHGQASRRRAVVPPLLNAAAAYRALARMHQRR